MNLYLVQSKSTMSNVVVAASNNIDVKSLFKYNYNLSDGNIILIGYNCIYTTPCIVVLNENNDPL